MYCNRETVIENLVYYIVCDIQIQTCYFDVFSLFSQKNNQNDK